MALNDLFYQFRNRLLGSARFRRIAQKIPLIHRLANREAVALFRVFSGYVHSQVMLACVRLGLIEMLRDGPLDVPDIATRAGTPVERTRHLLHAAAALEILERRPDGKFGLGRLGASMIDNPSVVAMVEHHAIFYEDLVDPVPLIRGTQTETKMSRLWPYATSAGPEALESADVTNYTAFMAASQAMVAEQVLEAFSFRDCRRLLDIGGGAGAFVIAVATQWKHIHATVADLPAVAEIATQAIAAADLGDRLTAVSADATSDELPGGFDVVSLVRVLHDHDDDKVLDLLRTARSAMADDGVLLVAEPMADARVAGPLIDAYFQLYLLAMGSGRPRTTDELSALFDEAGFGAPRHHRTSVPLITSVLSAAPK